MKQKREILPLTTLLQGAEPTLLLDTGHRVPLYAGESLEEALARARREVPEARTAVLQAYLNRRFFYSEPMPLETIKPMLEPNTAG